MLNCDILVPCKPLSLGKSRLAPFLSAPQRYDLCRTLLDRTLAVACALAQPGRVFLLTGDAEAASRAAGVGATVIDERANELNAALTFGRDWIATERGLLDRLLVLPIDLPFAGEDDLMTVAGSLKDIAIASDHGRSGTNLLMLRGRAAATFRFQFGTDSFARHCDSARRARHSLDIIDSSALAFDLDEPDHYLRAGRITVPKVLESI